MKTKVTKIYNITWTGDNPGYIKVARELTRRRNKDDLDSLDLGDATGAIIDWAEAPAAGDLGTEHDMCFFNFDGHALSVSYHWESFEYPEKGTGPEFLDD